MKRPIIYDDQIPLTLDLLDSSYFSQEAVALLLESVQRDSIGRRYGLEVVALPTPGMGVQISRGVATGLLAEDATAYGPRPASAATIVKLGYNPTTTTLNNPTFPSGQTSATVAVVATLVERDDDPQILPYYDPNSPGTAIPGSSAQNRRRICEIDFSFVFTTLGADPLLQLSSNQIPLAKFDMTQATTSIRNSGDSATAGSTPIIWFDDRRHIAPYAALPDQNTFTGDCTFTQSVELSGTANLDVGGRIDAGSGITGAALTSLANVTAAADVAALGNVTAAGNVTAQQKVISQVNAANQNDVPRLGQFNFLGTNSNTTERGYIKIPMTNQNGFPAPSFILQWGKIDAADMQPDTPNNQNTLGYGVYTDSLPLEFPQRCINAWASCHSSVYGGITPSYRTTWIGDFTETTITVYCAPNGIDTYWWAIGY